MRRMGVIGALVAACGLATTAVADTVTFTGSQNGAILLHSGTFALWKVQNIAGTNNGLPTGVCNNQPGLSVNDATYDPNGLNKGDAIDNGFVLWVDNHQFVSPDSVDVTDETLTAGPVTLSNLEVTVEYKALPNSPTLRALVAFHNPTATAVDATVVLSTNYGSDANTATRGEATGANWRVTSDDPTTPGDPPLLLVSYGPRSSVSDINTYVRFEGATDSVFECPASPEGRGLDDDLQVPPGATVYLMQFLRLAATNQEALDAAPTFDANPSIDGELMTGITRAQSLAIMNWNFFDVFAVSGGGAHWSVDGGNGTTNLAPTGGACGTIPGIAVVDADLVDPSKSDAFDGALLLFVGGEPLPVETDAFTDEQTVRVGPATLAGLEVFQSFAALQDTPTLRTLVSLHNSTAAPISTTVQLVTNVGSDNHTLIRATSDGDTTVSDADRWIVTSDDGMPEPGDPVNTHVVAGPGTVRTAPTLATRVFDCSDSTDPNGVLAAYDVTVAPGETQALLLFNQLHPTVPEATDGATLFDTTPVPSAGLATGMDPLDLSRVVNWNACRGATHPEVDCRLSGLLFDTQSGGTAGKTLDKVAARVGAARSAIEKSATGLNGGKKAAAKKGIKAASAALKTYEKLLKSKKAQAIIAELIRTRLAATSAEIRTTIKQLPTKL